MPTDGKDLDLKNGRQVNYSTESMVLDTSAVFERFVYLNLVLKLNF